MVGAQDPSVDTGGEVPTLDPAAIDALRVALPEPVVGEIVQNYLSDITRCVSVIVEIGTVAPTDTDTLTTLFERGHELKGCAGQVGAIKLQAMAIELEAVCKAAEAGDFGPFYRIVELQAEMPAELVLVTAALS